MSDKLDLNDFIPVPVTGEMLNKLASLYNFRRKIIYDGRASDRMIGLPLETDAEYRRRIMKTFVK